MRRYADRTRVPASSTVHQIETLVAKNGATRFAYTTVDDRNMAMVAFFMRDRMIRFLVPMPLKGEYMTTGRRGRVRKPAVAEGAYNQEVRRRWRSVLLMVKAKLEAMASGIATFESEFLAYIVMPNQQTVGDVIVPQLTEMYESDGEHVTLPNLDDRRRLLEHKKDR